MVQRWAPAINPSDPMNPTTLYSPDNNQTTLWFVKGIKN